MLLLSSRVQQREAEPAESAPARRIRAMHPAQLFCSARCSDWLLSLTATSSRRRRRRRRNKSKMPLLEELQLQVRKPNKSRIPKKLLQIRKQMQDKPKMLKFKSKGRWRKRSLLLAKLMPSFLMNYLKFVSLYALLP